MLLIKNYINTIFIMLGQHCNLSCKYCMQHDLIEHVLPNKNINKQIIDFIKINSDNKKKPIDVRFYGGEPLLYFNDIVTLVNELKHLNVTFSIITNGKLLNQKMINFFNNKNNKFTSIAISWDGPNSIKTRKYDVIKDKEDLILKLNNLCISGVCSAYNYHNDFIQSIIPLATKYNKIHSNKILNFSIDEIADNCATFTDLTNFDYDEVKNQMNKVVNNILKSISSFSMPNKEVSIEDYLYYSLFVMYCKLIQYGQNNEHKSFCANGTNTINLDLEGNLYQCHNNWIKIADINSIYDDYINKAKNLDKISKLNYETICQSCEVQNLCRNGCPLISNNIKEKSNYCKLRQYVYKPILDLINSFINKQQKLY